LRPARAAWSRLGAALVAFALGGAPAVALGGCGAGTEAPPATATTAATTSSSEQPATTTSLPGTGRPVITLGDKNTPEQFVLGELYDQALSAQGFTVTLTRNIGPASVSLQALQQGSLDIYPEYLNVWDVLAGQTQSFRSVADAYAVGSVFANEHGLQLLRPTPFSDTQGLAVLSSYAAADRIGSLADLEFAGPGLVVGAPIEFSQSPQGLPAIEYAYHFKPAKVVPIDIGSQYAALSSGQIQAAYVNTTDGQLSESAYRMLRDPRHILGFGNVVPVVSQLAIQREGPTFVATIDHVDALLSTPVIRELNAEVTLDHDDPTAVAGQFLESHGLLPVPSGAS
jgi:osmoprotectant transport system substrate-binding protein